MTTGTSACVHLRNIKRPCLSVRNDPRCGTVAQGIGRLNLRQSFGRATHAACRSTLHTRSFRWSGLAGALIGIKSSAFKEHWSANHACYLSNHRCVRGFSIQSPLRSQLTASETENHQHNLELSSLSPSEIDNDNGLVQRESPESSDSLKREYADFKRFSTSNILSEWSKSRGSQESGYEYIYRCDLGPRGGRSAFYAETKASSRVCEPS